MEETVNYPDFAYNPIADAVSIACMINSTSKLKVAQGRGIIVGIVAGIMSSGMVTFDEAIEKLIVDAGGDSGVDLNPDCVPPGAQWEKLYVLCKPNFDLMEAR